MQQHNSTATTKPAPVRLRPIALPVEHGGWSMVGMPIVLGLWFAPSLAGFWLSLAALGAFLVRQPLKLVVGDHRRGKRYPRTVWAERFVLGYGAITVIAFGMAWWYAAFPFWPPIMLAIPFAVVQLFFDLRKQSRALLAELAGAIAISVLAAVIVMAAGWTLWSALVLWLLLSLQAVTAIVYVRIRLRLAHNKPTHRAPALLLHLAALVIVAGLLSVDWVSWPVLLVFAFLFLRCGIGLLPRHLTTPTPLVGVQEVIVALLVVVGIRFGLS